MKKITSERICVSVAVNCFIDANKLIMYNVDTGETNYYSEIEESDIGNWILNDSVELLRDCDELDHDSIEFEEA